MNVGAKRQKTELKLERFYGYKHWTLEDPPRCFNVGKGRKSRDKSSSSRNHKWHAISKCLGLRIEVCIGPVTNEEACTWEIEQISKEGTFSTNHSHDDTDIGCNFTMGGEGMTGFCRPGWHHSEETKALIRERRPPGWHHCDAARRKIGIASSERERTPETREKNRLAAKRENLSVETLQRRSQALSKHTCKFDFKNQLIETFASLKLAAQNAQTSSAKLSVAIKLQKPCKGFIWKYESHISP